VLATGTTVAGSATPLSWTLASEGHLRLVWFSAFFDAVAWGAIGPAVFSPALASAPEENRTAFVAMYGFATGEAGFAGAILSGPPLLLFSRLAPIPIPERGSLALFALRQLAAAGATF